MKESKEMLRQRYQAETDIDLQLQPEDWEPYAQWLEELKIKKLNSELVIENEILLNKMRKAMFVLEEGITGGRRKTRKRRPSQNK